MTDLTWQEQRHAIEQHLGDLFMDHPEWFRPTEIIRVCSNPDCAHEDDEVDPSSYVVTGALMLVQQSSPTGAEITSVLCWPPMMGKVQKLGLIGMLEERMK